MRPVRKARRLTRPELESEVRRLRAELDDRRDTRETRALRETQRELESSRDHYTELYDFAPFGHLTLDSNGVIRSLNLTAAGLVGRQRQHLAGYPFATIVALGDRRRFFTYLSRMRRQQAYEVIELALRHAEGRFVAVQMVTIAGAPRGEEPPELQVALVDITERKRAEARTAALAKLGLMLSAATDPAAAAQAVADTALEFCGWDACFLQVYDAQTDTVTDLVNVDTIDGCRRSVEPMTRDQPPTPLMRRVMEKGPQLVFRDHPEDQAPLSLRFGDLAHASLSLMFVPIRLEGQSIGVLSVQSYARRAYTKNDLASLQALGDQVAGALARLQAQAALRSLNERLEQRFLERTVELRQYRDHLEELVQQRTAELEKANEQLRREVAQRKVAERALLEAAQELKRSNMDLEQFAYAASHDLQEPLRAVGGYVRLLEHRFPEKVDAKAREYIAGAADGAIRMERLITDLLSLSRINRSERRFVIVNLQVPLENALRNLHFRIRETGAKVKHAPLPTARVDAVQITLLFQNLIANAIKFAGNAPPEIHVGARAENQRCVVWVKDNGIGIAPEHFERIFKVFQRLHTRKDYEGTGIGLALCKRIVERHGGEIWVESEPGKGATFHFSLPREEAKEGEKSEERGPKSEAASEERSEESGGN